MNPATIRKLCDLSGMELFPEGTEGGLARWRDETHDVWIDGVRDRGAQVLVRGGAPERAVLSPRLGEALLADLGRGRVGAAPREAFRLAPDRESALSHPAPWREVGSCSRLRGGGLLLAVDGGPQVVLSPPAGIAGELTAEGLWEEAPVWRAVFESHEPDPETVAALAAAGPFDLTIVMATWCHLSKEHIPRLLRTLETAANPGARVRLIGVDHAFEEPPVIQELRVTNVPTVIVERGGAEQGRIVETPTAETLEGDLMEILRGETLRHPGRWLRRRRLARGELSLRSAGRPLGVESWELFEAEGGGVLLHSHLSREGSSTEVWHRLDRNLRPEMIEVTEREGAEASRLRALVAGDRLTVVARGGRCGKVEQSSRVPEAFAFASPAAAGAAGWLRLGEGGVAYALPGHRSWGAGTLHPASCRTAGTEIVPVGTESFQALRVRVDLAGEPLDWWLLPDLLIPVRGMLPGGVECMLESLETT